MSPYRVFWVALALAGVASCPSLAQGCTALPDFTYATVTDAAGDAQELKLDLLLPDATSPPPLVVWIHGGGWRRGSRAPVPDVVAALCGRGYAVASVDYRLSDVAIWPAQMQDVRAAVRWLRAHAAVYGYDPQRFATWGASAGGHLAAMLGTSADVGTVTVGGFTADLDGAEGDHADVSSRVQGVVDWYGASDLLALHFYPSTLRHESAGSDESRLLGAALPLVPDRAATADPGRYASADDPPFLLMHGTGDTVYVFAQSELLRDALRRAGVAVELVPVPDAGHGGSNFFSRPTTRQVVYDWLDRRLVPRETMLRLEAAKGTLTEGGLPATLVVRRSGVLGSVLNVPLVVSGRATPGLDAVVPARVVLGAGESAVELTVEALADTLREPPETLTVALAASERWGVDVTAASVRLTLLDAEDGGTTPAVSVAAVDAVASEEGDDVGRIVVALDAPATETLVVALALAGTATPGADYADPFAGGAATVTFEPGAMAVELEVVALVDAVAEAAETVLVAIVPGSDYVLAAPSAATVRIDDADPRPIVGLMATDPDAAEPADGGAFTVTRTGSTRAPLDVALHGGGSAEKDLDCRATPESVRFEVGESRVTVPVDVFDDATPEPIETVILAVLATEEVAAAAHLPGVAIADDDGGDAPLFADGFETGDFAAW